MKVTKPLAATASLALLAGSCAAIGLSPMNATAQAEPAGVAAESASVAAQSAVVDVPNVDGVFCFSQTALTKTADITKAFVKSGASLCASLPDYEVVLNAPIKASAGDKSITATVSEMTEEDAAIGMILACACASNLAGGGIIANADVSGISMASIAQMLGVAAK